eukprot:529839_1
MTLSLIDKIDAIDLIIEETIFSEDKERKLRKHDAQNIVKKLKHKLISHNIHCILNLYNFTRESTIFPTIHEHDHLLYGYCRMFNIPYGITEIIFKFYQILSPNFIITGGRNSHFYITPIAISKLKISSSSHKQQSFMSIQSDIPIPQQIGKYYYEFIVKSGSIDYAQIGFCDDYCTPDGMTYGIGDDNHSWAFDGGRICIWHGQKPKGNAYGRKWKIDDVVGCCLDLKSSKQFDLSFRLNGKFLGFAFKDCLHLENLYPACSFSASGENVFGELVFGRNEFKYMPKGYNAII